MQKKINTQGVIWLELLLSFFIGTVPILTAYYVNPNLDVVGQLASQKFDDPVVLYAAYLLAIHMFAWMLNKFWFKPNDFLVNTTRKIHLVTHQIGFSVLVIYRALVGAIPAALGILIYKHGFTDGFAKASVASVVMVVAAMYMCVSLSIFKEVSKP
jgi:hypothetical protein